MLYVVSYSGSIIAKFGSASIILCGDLNAMIGRNEQDATGPHANCKSTKIDNRHKSQQILLGLLRRCGLLAISTYFRLFYVETM